MRELLHDLARRRLDPSHAQPGGECDGTLGVEVQWVARCHDERSLVAAHWNHTVAARPLLGKERDGGRIGAREVGALEGEAAGGGHPRRLRVSACAPASRRRTPARCDASALGQTRELPVVTASEEKLRRDRADQRDEHVPLRVPDVALGAEEGVRR